MAAKEGGEDGMFKDLLIKVNASVSRFGVWELGLKPVFK